MLLLLSAHFCALSWFSSLTVLEARYNARRIKEDGANNSLRAGFHTRRTIIRIVVALLLAAAASTATPHYLVSAIGLLAAMAGFFLWYFSPALNKLRGLPAYKSVPILMLTTESGDAMKAQGHAAGATGWLTKPFDPGKLLEVMKKVLP